MAVVVLFVCTANVCRSPMAEALLRASAERRGAGGVVIASSAGVRARPGSPAAPEMQSIARDWALDLTRHRSRQASPVAVDAASLVVTMERHQRGVVARLAPNAIPRTFTLAEVSSLLDIGPPADPSSTSAELVAAWDRARSHVRTDVHDIEDPYGGPPAAYRATAELLQWHVDRLARALITDLATRD